MLPFLLALDWQRLKPCINTIILRAALGWFNPDSGENSSIAAKVRSKIMDNMSTWAESELDYSNIHQVCPSQDSQSM